MTGCGGKIGSGGGGSGGWRGRVEWGEGVSVERECGEGVEWGEGVECGV